MATVHYSTPPVPLELNSAANAIGLMCPLMRPLTEVQCEFRHGTAPALQHRVLPASQTEGPPTSTLGSSRRPPQTHATSTRGAASSAAPGMASGHPCSGSQLYNARAKPSKSRSARLGSGRSLRSPTAASVTSVNAIGTAAQRAIVLVDGTRRRAAAPTPASPKGPLSVYFRMMTATAPCTALPAAGTHSLRSSLRNWHVQYASQHVGPVQPRPPHCPYATLHWPSRGSEGCEGSCVVGGMEGAAVVREAGGWVVVKPAGKAPPLALET